MARKNFILKLLNGSTQDQPVEVISDTGANQAITGNQAADQQVSPITKNSLGKKVWKLILSLLISVTVYYLAWYLLSNHGVNPFLSHLVGYVLGLMLLAYINSIFESEVDMSKPVMLLMTILLFYNLSVIYLPEYGKAEKNNSKIELSSETGTLRSVGEVWFTDNIFKAGSNVEIKVSYQSIQMVGGKLYTPGVYKYIPPGDGKIIFKGIIDAPSNVKVSY